SYSPPVKCKRQDIAGGDELSIPRTIFHSKTKDRGRRVRAATISPRDLHLQHGGCSSLPTEGMVPGVSSRDFSVYAWRRHSLSRPHQVDRRPHNLSSCFCKRFRAGG